MHVLILGWSSLVQRRVLPALRALPGVTAIDLASTQVQGGDLPGWPGGLEGRLFGDYRDAVRASTADLVYVSLVNSAHQRWVEAALASGRHVVVDKPAALGAKATDAVLAQAARASRCLAEATVFSYHPQFAAVRAAFAEVGAAPTRATITFSFPPFGPGNFRMRRELGGGALWDLGPYAVAVGRVVFGDEPEGVDGRVLGHDGEVDCAFTVNLVYPNGRSVVGTFGFDTVYRNRLDLIGPRLGVEFDRAFTAPPDLANELRLTGPSGSETVVAPAGDAFEAFFEHVIVAIRARDWTQLAEDMAADARVLQRLRDAAGVESA